MPEKRKKKLHKKKEQPFLTHEELQRRMQLLAPSTINSDNNAPIDDDTPEKDEAPLNTGELVPEVFRQTIEKFKEREQKVHQNIVIESDTENEAASLKTDQNDQKNAKIDLQSKEPTENHQNEVSKKISRKKEKEFFKSKVSQLKVMVDRPDLVESWDVTAPDPVLLIHLKSTRSSVPVPKHWSQKKKFLQNKRGVFKRAFRLPAFIEATGISKLRDPLSEISSVKMIKQKLKERMNPRLGKIDIDYQTLHDAFFKYQTKPKLTMFGDIFYEGKEEDQKIRAFKPGKISSELRAALGISETAPFPWLANMQRFGPPPAYPNLKIFGFSLEAWKKSQAKEQQKKEAESDDDDWEWMNEGYLFGAVMEDKEEPGERYEDEHEMREEHIEEEIQRTNENNPYFHLETFGISKTS